MVSTEELLRTADALSTLKLLVRTDLMEKSFIPEECTPDEVVEAIMTTLSEWTRDFVSEIQFKEDYTDAETQASKIYEPTMAEREHIARALDRSAKVDIGSD